MWDFIRQEARRLRDEEKGVVLIIFVLVLVPLLLVVAVGIDFSQTLVVKRQLANGVDAAALAIGTQRDLTEQADMDAEAERYIRSHYNEVIGNLSTFAVTRTSSDPRVSEVHVTATAEIATNFMSFGGVDSLTVSVESTVVRQDTELEVVMVLDNSGSMGSGSKMASMQAAANTLVDSLFGDETESDNIRIGLVPFTGAVNVGVPASTPWLDQGNPASINGQYLDLPASITLPEVGQVDIDSAFDVLDLVMSGDISSNWGGCVRSRFRFDAGVDDLDIVDTPPTAADPETLFSAYFDPFNGRDILSYLLVSSNLQNSDCPDAPIQTLTNNKETIQNAISAMTASGATNIPEALSWGWRTVSPGEPFTEGQAYSDDGVIKAIILLTDGENAINSSETAFSSYGRRDNPQLQGNPNGTLNTKTAQICENIKADQNSDAADRDILLYTIIFNVSSTTITNLMQNCATEPTLNEFFFNSPTANDIESVFQTIAASLNQLRITQ
ncbi:MAG: VWA domain-containing protein [Hyphomicrobiales bacterium]|nr:VWA domain-containing protein [Hyphomicrobiales bacterium]